MNFRANRVEKNTTHKECKGKEFCLQARPGGEICSSGVIMYKSQYLFGFSLGDQWSFVKLSPFCLTKNNFICIPSSFRDKLCLAYLFLWF